MKITSLELENFRCFESIRIEFDERLTVLVAENGGGKTTVLDGIAVALGVFVGSFDAGVNKGFKAHDARFVKKNETTMEALYPVAMQAEGLIVEESQVWRRKLTSSKSKTTVGEASSLRAYGKSLQKKVRFSDEAIDLPIVAYYGAGRLWRQIQAKESFSKESFSRLFGYHDALEPASNYKEFEKWFRDTSLAEYKGVVAKVQAGQITSPADLEPEETNALKNVREVVDNVLRFSGWQRLHYDANTKELAIRHQEKGVMPVNMLSDGVKSMLAMTADIAYRCAKLNPHLSKPHQETEGIVLIDEVDMHLHPKWQQTVLQDLQNAFPKIQFIVTTHSPQVLSTVKRESIRLIGKNTQGDDIAAIPMAHSYGEISGNVLESIMHVNPQPPVAERKDLEELTEWIEQGQYNSSEVKLKLQELKSALGKNHPQLQRLERSIKRQEILNS